MKKIGLFLLPALIAGAAATPRPNFEALESATTATARSRTSFEKCSETVEVCVDAVRAIESAAEKLRSADAYTAVAAGETVARKGFISYKQQITDTVVGRRGECYARSESSSAFVKMKHEAYARNGRVAYRDGGGNILTASAAEYAEIYGVIPGEGLDGHSVRGDTIVSARFVGEENGLLSYYYEIDESGSVGLRRQMQKFGGLKKPPEMKERSRLTLTVKGDFTPVALASEENYSIVFGFLGSLSCVQKLNYTFSYGGAAVPDEAAFAAATE